LRIPAPAAIASESAMPVLLASVFHAEYASSLLAMPLSNGGKG